MTSRGLEGVVANTTRLDGARRHYREYWVTVPAPVRAVLTITLPAPTKPTAPVAVIELPMVSVLAPESTPMVPAFCMVMTPVFQVGEPEVTSRAPLP